MSGARSRSSGVGKAKIIIPILLIRKSRLAQVMEFAKGHTAEQVTDQISTLNLQDASSPPGDP